MCEHGWAWVHGTWYLFSFQPLMSVGVVLILESRRGSAFVRFCSCCASTCSHCFLHLSLNSKGHWGTTEDLTTSFLHSSPFLTALRDLANSRPVHSLMMSYHLFCFFVFLFCLSSFFFHRALHDGFCQT